MSPETIKIVGQREVGDFIAVFVETIVTIGRGEFDLVILEWTASFPRVLAETLGGTPLPHTTSQAALLNRIEQALTGMVVRGTPLATAQSLGWLAPSDGVVEREAF